MHNPFVPETLEGWSLLHLMYRVRWDRLRARVRRRPRAAGRRGGRALAVPDAGATAFVQMLGHKADLMFICFRRGFERAGAGAAGAVAHRAARRTSSRRRRTCRSSSSGMYEMTAQDARAARREAQAGQRRVRAGVRRRDGDAARSASMSRLFLELPKCALRLLLPDEQAARRDARTGTARPFERRAAMMREHGMIGRHYAGKVTQVISGSIGYDDWEWGVDLFAQDPLVFKKLIYEMRFDEASAKFAEFGPFYTGLQFAPGQLASFLAARFRRWSRPESGPPELNRIQTWITVRQILSSASTRRHCNCRPTSGQFPLRHSC